MLDKLKSKWTVIIVVLSAALAFSHWWVYRLGGRVEHDRMATLMEVVFNSEQEEALRQRVEFLRILAKNPQAFDFKDVKSYCLSTLALAKSLEMSGVEDARKAGDDPKADKLQQQADEARHLVTLVTKGRR